MLRLYNNTMGRFYDPKNNIIYCSKTNSILNSPGTTSDTMPPPPPPPPSDAAADDDVFSVMKLIFKYSYLKFILLAKRKSNKRGWTSQSNFLTTLLKDSKGNCDMLCKYGAEEKDSSSFKKLLDKASKKFKDIEHYDDVFVTGHVSKANCKAFFPAQLLDEWYRDPKKGVDYTIEHEMFNEMKKNNYEKWFSAGFIIPSRSLTVTQAKKKKFFDAVDTEALKNAYKEMKRAVEGVSGETGPNKAVLAILSCLVYHHTDLLKITTKAVTQFKKNKEAMEQLKQSNFDISKHTVSIKYNVKRDTYQAMYQDNETKEEKQLYSEFYVSYSLLCSHLTKQGHSYDDKDVEFVNDTDDQGNTMYSFAPFEEDFENVLVEEKYLEETEKKTDKTLLKEVFLKDVYERFVDFIGLVSPLQHYKKLYKGKGEFADEFKDVLCGDNPNNPSMGNDNTSRKKAMAEARKLLHANTEETKSISLENIKSYLVSRGVDWAEDDKVTYTMSYYKPF